VEYFTKEIEINGKESKSYSSRAYCFVRMFMYEEAIQDYTQALLTDPNNLHYLHNRGICYQKVHEYEKAVKDFT
jgi:tetratricopeptide (TPR) repeat protein